MIFLLTIALASEPVEAPQPQPVLLSDADRLELIQDSYKLKACRKREVKHKDNLNSCDSDLTIAKDVARELKNEIVDMAKNANSADSLLIAERDALALELSKSRRNQRRLNVLVGVIGGVGLGYTLALYAD